MTDHYYTENPHSKIERKTITYTFQQKPFVFTTGTGVFSKDKIDYGSRVLIESFQAPEIDGPILDLGCGYGPVGIMIASQYTKRQVMMVDINERALDFAKENIKQNGVEHIQVMKSDGLDAITDGKFAAIITNPPIRQGKETIYRLFDQAKVALLPGGELWIVIQKKQGAPSALNYLRTLFQEAEIVTRNKGYYVIVAK